MRKVYTKNFMGESFQDLTIAKDFSWYVIICLSEICYTLRVLFLNQSYSWSTICSRWYIENRNPPRLIGVFAGQTGPVVIKFVDAELSMLFQLLIKTKMLKNKDSSSALVKLLDQFGIYATWLSSNAYLQKQLRIFYICLCNIFDSDYTCFLIEPLWMCLHIYSNRLPF